MESIRQAADLERRAGGRPRYTANPKAAVATATSPPRQVG